MRHQKKGRKLGRNSAQRRALFQTLSCQVIEHGRIRTTLAKAKEVRPVVEEMITLGKLGARQGDAAEMAYIELV